MSHSQGPPRLILYGAPNPAPNPRRVRIFLDEKGNADPILFQHRAGHPRFIRIK